MIVQFASFASAGALGTIVHYFVLLGLVSIFLSRPVTASILGSLAGAIVNYLLSRRTTTIKNFTRHWAISAQ